MAVLTKSKNESWSEFSFPTFPAGKIATVRHSIIAVGFDWLLEFSNLRDVSYNNSIHFAITNCMENKLLDVADWLDPRPMIIGEAMITSDTDVQVHVSNTLTKLLSAGKYLFALYGTNDIYHNHITNGIEFSVVEHKGGAI